MTQQTEMIDTPDQQYDCIIVGAGHNGLATGLVLARNGQKVLILEKMPKEGRKLLITG